jgi:hypothetical protein
MYIFFIDTLVWVTALRYAITTIIRLSQKSNIISYMAPNIYISSIRFYGPQLLLLVQTEELNYLESILFYDYICKNLLNKLMGKYE